MGVVGSLVRGLGGRIRGVVVVFRYKIRGVGLDPF